MKIMISQPMKGIPQDQIEKNRKDIVEKLTEEGHEIINTIFTDEPPKDNNQGVWYLGKSLQAMSTVDAVYFMDGWENARGCKLEHEVCTQYGIKIIYESGSPKK